MNSIPNYQYFNFEVFLLLWVHYYSMRFCFFFSLMKTLNELSKKQLLISLICHYLKYINKNYKPYWRQASLYNKVSEALVLVLLMMI